MTRSHAVPAVVVMLLAACAAVTVARADNATSKVMGSISIDANQQSGDLSTVNGSIHIGEGAVVGHASTVNGGISVEPHATAAGLTTVNGSIHLREAARVSGGISSVNGGLTLENGAEVAQGMSNVNGSIHVAAAHVGGLIDTVSGDLDLGPNARVDGGIHMHEDSSWFHLWFWSEDLPRVVVRAGSVVGGTLKFERKVKLYVSDRATIGAVEGASVVRFAGAEPPK